MGRRTSKLPPSFTIPDTQTKPLPPSGLHRIPPQSQGQAIIMASDEKRDYCSAALTAYKGCLQLAPVRSNAELMDRSEQYFTFCGVNRLFPTVEGLASFLGYGVRTLLAWQHGERRGFNDGDQTTGELIERIKGVIDSLDGELVTAGKIPPIPWIFRRKSISGWVETQKIQIDTAGRNEPQPLSPEEIARRLPDPDDEYPNWGA